ncbi:MAG: acyltransferase family protein [Ilumatobacter sp.]
MGQVYEGEAIASRSPARSDDGAPIRLGQQPALDGVRGIAVFLVVVFHLGTGFLTGGYLGVSVFFTLSGFLITTLLLERFDDTGDLALRGFYVRRIKRLLPASSLTLVTVAALTAGGAFFSTSRSQGDIVAAALNVFNWREVASGRDYADLFAGDSPVAHFWSLAIEEQFYIVWPLVLLALLRFARCSPSTLVRVVGALFLTSAIAAQFGSANLAYFASWNRAAEILAGAALAAWLTRAGHMPRWWRWLPGPALTLILLLSLTTPAATGWAYSGGLPLFSLLSVALIAGLQQPNRVRTALSWKPLVALGRISYGVYLVHWPVFVYVDEVRMGVDGWNLTVTRLMLTALLSGLLFVAVERPVRYSPRIGSLTTALVFALAMSSFVVIVARSAVESPNVAAPAPAVLGGPVADDVAKGVTSEPAEDVAAIPASASATPIASTADSPSAPVRVVPGAPAVNSSVTGPTTDPIAAAGPIERANEDADGPVLAALPTPDAAPVAPTSIAVFGDSVPAWLLRDAAAAFERRDVVLLNGARESCDGAVALPIGRDRRRAELQPPDDCMEWTASYPDVLQTFDAQVDVGLLVLGQAPTVDRFIDDAWQHPCDSTAWYLDDVRNRIDFLRSESVKPVIALPARFGQRASFILPDDYSARMSCVRTGLTALAFEQQVATVDLDGLLCTGDDCDEKRSRDGIHVDPEVAADVLNELVELTLALRA